MILKSYEVYNWGPHKHQKLEFDPQAKTIAICAENDQGKSWILRGIGFTLSIGRNEYGDQTSIHAGESEARHILSIEHKNETYTIEKIVRGKSSENEGTKTFLNGTEVDRATYENFYQETLGLPHPSVWLPLTIAMQNQTDFHLRSKKSEREEALRAACQLNKIDSWKDALQAKTNEEDKKLLAKSSELKGTLDTLLKSQEKISQEEKTLQEKYQQEKNPPVLGTPISLNDIIINLEKLEKSQEEQEKTGLEILTLQKTKDLLEGTLQRALQELEKIHGFSPEEEEQTEKTRESILYTLHNLQKSHLLRNLKETSKKLIAKEKDAEKIPKNLKQTIQTKSEQFQNALEKSQKISELTQQIEQNILKNPNIQKEKSKLHTHLESKENLFGKILQAKTCIELLKNDLETHLGPTLNWEEANTKLTNKQKTLPPLSSETLSHLTAQLIHHWNHPKQKECPLCLSSLIHSPLNHQAQREAKLLETEEHLHSQRTPSELILPFQTLKTTLLRWKTTEEEIKTLTPLPPEETLKTLKQEIKNLTEALKTQEDQKTLCLQKTSYEKELQQILQNSNLEALKIELTNLQNLFQTQTILHLEIEHLEKELQNFEASLEHLPTWEGNTYPLVDLTKEELQQELKKLTETLAEKRKTRQLKTQKEKEVTQTQEKLQNLLINLEAQRKKLQAEEKIQENLSIPTPLENPNLLLKERITFWKALAKTHEKTKNLLEEIPKQKQEISEDIEKIQTQLHVQKSLITKIDAAKRLIQFLDYKNAPRKLLQNIVEKLFETTNKLGQALEVDLFLQAGKNLEFLTKQKRSGHWIEQKTERLGFGKGAILGICFRIACQKLLLPDTGFLILDEPTANVDLKRKSALKNFLQNLAEETSSKTKQIILIEHDLDVIELCQSKIHIGENTP